MQQDEGDRVTLHSFECNNIMEALAQVLSCPVCLEFFTPPVLVLSCSHNFCRKCLEKILIRQNCSHVNGQFSCPMCRKIIHLRGRGIIGLPRNILVENILEKFKYELGNLQTKEQDQLSQICEEHGESMNLVCLTDDKPICAICKLFGDHEPHTVAKLSEVYAERKERFVKDLDWVCKQSECAEQARKCYLALRPPRCVPMGWKLTVQFLFTHQTNHSSDSPTITL
nr:E3 ubiquitin-protein ligase Midline-1 [Pogona vitticeps]